MAELHRFKDDVAAGEIQISANDLDENFRTVRLRLDSSIETAFQIRKNKGAADTLEINAPDGEGTFVLGFVDGNLTWIETEDCE
jgi:hypothetical protein